MAGIYKPRADPHEKQSIFFVLGAEFGCDDVHRGLRHRVQRASLYLEIIDPINVCTTTGYVDDLLDLAFEKKRDEQAVEVNITNDIDIDQLLNSCLHFFWCFVSVSERKELANHGA